MAAKPKVRNYLQDPPEEFAGQQGLRFPMSQEQFLSLSPATQSSVMQAMSQVDDKGRPLLSYSDYITDSQMSAVTSKAPKKEVYVPSGSATMVDPDTGDQYSSTGARLQQMMMRRKRQGLPDLISLDEYKKRRKAANEKLSKEVTDKLPDGAELMIPAAKAEEAKQAKEDQKRSEITKEALKRESITPEKPLRPPTEEPRSPRDRPLKREKAFETKGADPVVREMAEQEDPPTKEEALEVDSIELPESEPFVSSMTEQPIDRESTRESDMFGGGELEEEMGDQGMGLATDSQQAAVQRMTDELEELDQLAAEARADAAFTDAPKTSKRMSDAEIEQFYSAIFPDNAFEQNEELANEFAKLLRSMPDASDISAVKQELMKRRKQFAPLLGS